jgi:hypothetical protein
MGKTNAPAKTLEAKTIRRDFLNRFKIICLLVTEHGQLKVKTCNSFFKGIISIHSEIPSFSSPSTGEDESGGEKITENHLINYSPSPVSPSRQGRGNRVSG